MVTPEEVELIAAQVLERTMELVFAPLNNTDMLWGAIPLVIATLFMTLYFGRYSKEELGWNTAFGNTMVFIFVALNVIRELYEQGGGTFDGLLESTLHSAMVASLIGGGLLLMFITYFHLLPRKVAFFLFSAPPINVSIYVIMCIAYAKVAPDYVTALAAVVLLVILLIILRLIQALEWFAGLSYEIERPKDIIRKFEKLDERLDERQEREKRKKELMKEVLVKEKELKEKGKLGGDPKKKVRKGG